MDSLVKESRTSQWHCFLLLKPWWHGCCLIRLCGTFLTSKQSVMKQTSLASPETLPETNSKILWKLMVGWEIVRLPFGGKSFLSGAFAVGFREGKYVTLLLILKSCFFFDTFPPRAFCKASAFWHGAGKLHYKKETKCVKTKCVRLCRCHWIMAEWINTNL